MRLPGSELLLEKPDELPGLHVAGDGDHRVVRHPPASVKGGEIGGGDRADGLRCSPGGLTPGMLGTVEDPRCPIRGQRAGIRLLLLQSGELEQAHPLDVLVSESGVFHHVREQLQRLGKRLGEAVEAHVRSLQRHARAEVRREVLDLLRELLGGARLRPLVDHVRDEIGEPRLLPRIGVDSVEETHADGDQGQAVVLDDQHPGAVLQSPLHGNGRIEVRLARERRRDLSPKRLVRHQRRFRHRVGGGLRRLRRRGRCRGRLRGLLGLLADLLRGNAAVRLGRGALGRDRRRLVLGRWRALLRGALRSLPGSCAGDGERCEDEEALHCRPPPALADRFGAGITSSSTCSDGKRYFCAKSCADRGVTAR